MSETSFDVQALGKEMLDAARATLGGRAPALRAVAEAELQRLAGALADIGSLLARGEIDQERARTLISIHQLSVRSVLRSVEGLTLAAADRAMQAAIRVAGAVVNRAVGFTLL
jgi:hypothetical protein